MSTNIEKYEGEKDLALDTEVTVLPESDWVSFPSRSPAISIDTFSVMTIKTSDNSNRKTLKKSKSMYLYHRASIVCTDQIAIFVSRKGIWRMLRNSQRPSPWRMLQE